MEGEDDFSKAAVTMESEELKQFVSMGPAEQLKQHRKRKLQKAMLTDSEIHKHFTDLWQEKGDLLVYKSFISLYPDYVLWYDQIYGSIPPDGEVEIAYFEMDNQSGECCLDAVNVDSVSNIIATSMFEEQIAYTYTDAKIREHLHSDVANKEHHCSDVSNKEHLYSDVSNKEHLYSDVSNKKHHCSDVSDKEHLYSDVSNKEHLYSDVSNKEHLYSDVSNKEHLYSDVSNKKHHCSDVSDKEHLYSDVSNKEHLYRDVSNKEHLYSDVSNKKHYCSDVGDKEDLYADLGVENVFSSKLLELAKNADLGVSMVKNVGVYEKLELGCKLSHKNSNSGVETFGEISQSDREHCYRSLKSQDNFYCDTNTHTGNVCCQNVYVFDDVVESDDKHEELIATLKDTHGDLRNQVYRHVKDKFSQWLRSNKDEEFDISCLDEDLVAVYPFSEAAEVVAVECVEGIIK